MGFGGFGGENMQQIMKQAQAMQRKLQEAQEQLAEEEVTGTAGGGMVEVTVDGKHLIKSIKINPDAVDPDDIEMLEDLVTVAVNEAINKAVRKFLDGALLPTSEKYIDVRFYVEEEEK